MLLLKGKTNINKVVAPPRPQELPGKAKAPVQRGKGAKKKHKRGGQALKEAEGDEKAARVARLAEREGRRVDAHRSDDFFLLTHSNPSATGWQGKLPPVKDRNAVLQAYLSGRITDHIASFYPVYYDEYVIHFGKLRAVFAEFVIEQTKSLRFSVTLMTVFSFIKLLFNVGYKRSKLSSTEQPQPCFLVYLTQAKRQLLMKVAFVALIWPASLAIIGSMRR